MQRLHAAGLLTPAPYDLDQSGELFATPYLVVEYIEGQPEFAPANVADLVRQMATQLAGIHAVDCSRLELSFLPRQAIKIGRMLRDRPANVDEAWNEGRIRDTLEAVWPLPQRNPPVLLHGDFWPGNLLWPDGRLVGVIDWEDAALGDPLADVANSRLELLWACGGEAMQWFTRQYQALTGVDCTDLPYWDLCAALRPVAHIAQWGLDDATEKTMRERHGWFVSRACEQLPTR